MLTKLKNNHWRIANNHEMQNEINRLKSLCWFYMLTTFGFAITSIIFCLAWLDMVNFFINQ